MSGLPRAVLFDMDGLLLDSERAMQACLEAAAHALGETIEAGFWLGMVGKDDVSCRAAVAERIGRQRGEALLTLGKQRYAELAARGIAHRPGVLALLQWLRAHGIARAVGTSTARPLALCKLQAAGLLEYFTVIATSSDVQHAKPAPDIYLLAAAQLGVAAADCLVLEDSVVGVRAALAAGIRVIQIPDLLPADAEVRALGHRIMASLTEVQQLLQAQLAAR
jgi:HAD superfamily hydrolase (TIGR01509 family)